MATVSQALGLSQVDRSVRVGMTTYSCHTASMMDLAKERRLGIRVNLCCKFRKCKNQERSISTGQEREKKTIPDFQGASGGTP